MVQPKDLLKASLEAGRELFRHPTAPDTAPHAEPTPAAHHHALSLVPIRAIGPSERERVARHLLHLEPQDRYLRFGYAATDEHIRRYVSGLDFDRDDIFGIYNRKLELIAMAHLAYAVDPRRASCAEFGVSVLPHARGRGYGARLFDRAVMHARNQGVTMIFIHALTENTTMLGIARKAGATVVRDGSESEAHLSLSPANLDTHVSELVEQQFAEADYLVKSQSKRLHDEREDKRSFLQKLAEFIHPGPDSTEELIAALADAEDNNVIGAESRVMLEGVLRMADMSAGDVMVAAPRMDLLDIDATMTNCCHSVIETGAFALSGLRDRRENVIGILMAKDLLKLQRAPELSLRTLLRPAVFVPESKR
jgi:GNAT superfamily N-acetyltransferase